MNENGIKRRELLVSGPLIGTASMASAAVPGSGLHSHAGLIDVHHHIRPPNAPPALMALMPDWSPQNAIAGMDEAGIATGIAWTGAARVDDTAKRRMIVRGWNEYGAKLGQDHPGRFGQFASLPFPDVDGCLAEIDFALDQLHVDGFGITTSYGELWLGNESFWPIYEKLNSRNAVVFVHPTDAACCMPGSMTYMRAMMDGSWIEWPMNTARTILSLMVSGTLRKFPNLRFIFCHGGGVMPLLVNRVAGLAAWKHVGPEGLASVIPDGIETEFSKLHFECAQACSHPNMDALRTLVPDTQILYGSDFPFFPLPYGAKKFAELNLPPATAHAIGRGNAEILLPRWS
jgi:predicted TIM-barrel fold metal-dependent hydrolase